MLKFKSARTIGIAAAVLVSAMACNTGALGQTTGTNPAVTQPPSQSFGSPTADSACTPAITFASVPADKNLKQVQGHVECVDPNRYRVAVYAYASGWWNEPGPAMGLTTIQSDRTWKCDIVAPSADRLVTEVAAFLVPLGFEPLSPGGAPALPSNLFQNSTANVVVHHQPSLKTIQFSGYAWEVKGSETPVGPGPNYFSDRAEDVWVDRDDRLHMAITYRNGKWYSTEISSVQAFGYGTFSFTLASRVDQLDKNVVLGMFTWDETAQPENYREMDIELSRWGNAAEANAQFVVQPGQRAGNRRRFDMQLQEPISTHRFVWSASAIRFSSFAERMSTPDSGSPIEAWTYKGPGVPLVGPVHARINLWLYQGNPPANGKSVQVIIQAFQFIPLK